MGIARHAVLVWSTSLPPTHLHHMLFVTTITPVPPSPPPQTTTTPPSPLSLSPQGRNPFFLEPAVIIAITDSSNFTTAERAEKEVQWSLSKTATCGPVLTGPQVAALRM